LGRETVPNFCLGGALVFRYFDEDGKPNCYIRAKPRFPRKGRNGKPIKYESPVGQPPRAYIPPTTRRLLRDGIQEIDLTEGEKKTLALSQLARAAIGIGGVWCGCKKGEDGKYRLIDDLAAINWLGKVVYITFDFDPEPNVRRHVAAAAMRLAKALRAAGAKEVYWVELPPGHNGAKNGVDDFLMASGADGPEAYRRLVEQAQPVPVMDDYAPLTKAEGRTDANNAVRLVARYEDVARWAGPWDKWLLWDGSRWKIDHSLGIDLKAKDIAAGLFAEIAAALKENKE
jgi:putative DNA primase/helicase